MYLSLLDPPGCEPITLDEAKAFLKLSDTHDDPYLEMLISAARTSVENRIGRVLIKQRWELSLTPPYPPSFPLTHVRPRRLSLRLPLPPLLEVVSFRSKGHDVSYEQEGENVLISSSFFGEPLTLSFWSGYGESPRAVPPALRMAVLKGVRFLYEGEEIDLPLLTPYKVFHLS